MSNDKSNNHKNSPKLDALTMNVPNLNEQVTTYHAVDF